MATEDDHGILQPGRNCWRCESVEQGAFIIGGEAYFRAFREVLLQADDFVCILAWDLMERVELLRDEEPDDGLPSKLGDFLYALLERKPHLEIYILLWDYSIVYLAEREWLPFTRFEREPHPRLHLKKDDALSVGASHHQKVVVVDGVFAFCGGLDFSAWRWDSTAHHARDRRRRDPEGKAYQPYHDVEVAVTGPVVDALLELCARRWERGVGESAEWALRSENRLIWPESIEVDFRAVPAGVARTYSAYQAYPAVREIEQLHLDLIRHAERYLYLENQYLSSHCLTDALCERLKEPAGPEVVIILTRDTGGWMEEGTLGLLRRRLLERMHEADRYGRLGTYYPHVCDEDGHESQVYVHAKIMIVDDCLVKIGSANLSNRSMKVDSEVDLLFGNGETFKAARTLLRTLLGIHFAADRASVEGCLERTDSLNAAIRELRSGRLHLLKDLDGACVGPLSRKLADSQLLDPDDPIDPGFWIREAIRSEVTTPSHPQLKKYARIGGWILGGLLLAYGVKAAWGSVIDQEAVEAFFGGVRDSPYIIPLLFGIFFLSGLLAISLNLMLVAATLALGPWLAFGCGFSASLLSAIVAFYLGGWAGQPVVEKFFGKQFQVLSGKIRNRGVLSIALLRVLPIAPFFVINLVAGMSRMRLSTFTLGSVIGMVPGMLAVVLVTYQAKNVYADPGWKTWLLLALVVAAAVGLSLAMRRLLKS